MLKKTIKKSISLLLITLVLSQLTQSAFANFTDVKTSHKNFEAINFLQEAGILNGYTDGSFRPDKEVTRAEFLKIVIEGSNLETDNTEEIPFEDVHETAWYYPYIQKAYHEHFVIGYSDGTFKPEQTINKVEALKILALVQNWELSKKLTKNPFKDVPRLSWFAEYVAYAKDHSLLEETGENFEPSSLMSRANISEIIFRTIDNTNATKDVEDTTEDSTADETQDTATNAPPANTNTTPKTQTKLDFKPVNFETIEEDFYSKIILDEKAPNTFYQGEVYIFEGTITAENYKTATVFLEDDNSNTAKYTIFNEATNDSSFAIPVFFSNPGNYFMGILPGETGKTAVAEIAVLPSLPKPTGKAEKPSKALNPELKFKNDKTKITFNADTSTLKKINFTQNSLTHTVISRQNFEEIPLNYADFEDFTKSNISYNIETAHLENTLPLTIESEFSASESKSFKPLNHTFSYIDSSKISATPPETLSSIGEISFSGTLKADAKEKAYVIKPDGMVESFSLETTGQTATSFGNTIIKSGGKFTFNYVPEETGTYIIEINDTEGIALINHPVYIGKGTPLLPDFGDLMERSFFEGTLSLTGARNEMLKAINKSRKETGLNEIKLKDDLNDLAQGHSDDMATHNFFSHINLEGESPDDRRKKAGIKTPVGENLAKDVSIDFAHYGLMRSAAHRQLILDKTWETVGIGISLKNGYLYVAEEFSLAPINIDDLEDFRDELLEKINEERQKANIAQLIYSTNLQNASEYLNTKIIEEDTTVTNELLGEALKTYGITGNSQSIGRNFNIWSEILSSIISEEDQITNDAWTSIGIDIAIDTEGRIQATIIFNQQ
ncbi:S-layer homology domain-containing protein [Candidatus Peregrinibacteria bacterium]|nr:S-layer homology domain-containing protein [Candidatus Peregrinibacteria bacterium]